MESLTFNQAGARVSPALKGELDRQAAVWRVCGMPLLLVGGLIIATFPLQKEPGANLCRLLVVALKVLLQDKILADDMLYLVRICQESYFGPPWHISHYRLWSVV